MRMSAGFGLINRTILVVEDEYFLADELALTLRDYGARVAGPTRDPEAATEILSCSKIDGAILDIRLGPVKAFDLADRLQTLVIPFVFVSGYTPDVVPRRLARVPYFAKPAHMEDVVRAMSKMLTGLGPRNCESYDRSDRFVTN